MARAISVVPTCTTIGRSASRATASRNADSSAAPVGGGGVAADLEADERRAAWRRQIRDAVGEARQVAAHLGLSAFQAGHEAAHDENTVVTQQDPVTRGRTLPAGQQVRELRQLGFHGRQHGLDAANQAPNQVLARLGQQVVEVAERAEQAARQRPDERDQSACGEVGRASDERERASDDVTQTGPRT